MIRGIGTDIIEIESIQKSMEQSKQFAQRVFAQNEMTYCENKSGKYKHYAARFAAKEAVMKALGTGWDKGVQWKQIEVTNRVGGAPEIVTSGRVKELLDEMGVTNIKVSLSHSRLFAVAVVCVE